jgi:uncharacterized tellurite resistance protein B-like protein
MEFTLIEKLAIVKAIDEVITADEVIAKGEIDYLIQLMNVLDFDNSFVEEARKFNSKQAVIVLNDMSENKKSALAIMMLEMARADGEVDESELQVILSIFVAAGIDISDSIQSENKFDVSNIYFESSDHLRYEDGIHVSGPHGGAPRAVKVEPNITGGNGYSVTIFNLAGNHPLWGNNVQVAPKQMKIIESNPEKTILRGFGEDPRAMGHPDGKFSNYGISIFHPNNTIEKIILHMHDRNVDLVYLK